MIDHRDFEIELKGYKLFLIVGVVFATLFLLGYAAGRNNCRKPSAQTPSQEKAVHVPAEVTSRSKIQVDKKLEAPDRFGLAIIPAAQAAEHSVTIQPIITLEEEDSTAALPQPEKAVRNKAHYIQVSSVGDETRAVKLVADLSAKGYHAIIDDQSRPGWFRVQVGPFSDVESLERVRRLLRSDGMETLLVSR